MAIIEGTFEKSSSLRVAIVIARFNDLITNKLLSGCLDCLSRHGIDVSESSSQLDIAWVPGAFELPIVSQKLAQKGNYDVVVTLGIFSAWAKVRKLRYFYNNTKILENS